MHIHVHIDIMMHPLSTYLSCFWSHDDTAEVLALLELLHVLIKDTNLLFIVPARWTAMGEKLPTMSNAV